MGENSIHAEADGNRPHLPDGSSSPSRLTPAEQEALVHQWDGYAWQLATKWQRRFPTANLEDLYQSAKVGFVVAARRFDPGRGLKYQTYATHWALRYVREACREAHHGGIHVTSGKWKPVAPVSAHGCGDDGKPRLNQIPDRDHQPAGFTSDAFWEFPDLSARHAEVLRLRYRDGLKLEQIGKRMGITRERVRQIEVKAMQKLADRRPDLEDLIGE